MEEKIYIREFIQLTPFGPEDKPNMLLYLNDPVVYRNTLPIPSPYTETDAEWWIGKTRENFEEYGRTYNWAIRHANHGLIGSVGVLIRTGVEGHLDEIGYWLAEPFRGQGIVTDAVKALSNWLFEIRPALVRIEAKVYSFNPASVRVLEKAGFEREGLMRKATIKNGELIDTILMAKIRPGME